MKLESQRFGVRTDVSIPVTILRSECRLAVNRKASQSFDDARGIQLVHGRWMFWVELDVAKDSGVGAVAGDEKRSRAQGRLECRALRFALLAFAALVIVWAVFACMHEADSAGSEPDQGVTPLVRDDQPENRTVEGDLEQGEYLPEYGEYSGDCADIEVGPTIKRRLAEFMADMDAHFAESRAISRARFLAVEDLSAADWESAMGLGSK
jgi:hypothetical protein